MRQEHPGGGFEHALTNDVIIAERGSRMGLPEVLFNMFPGMGAYSFLDRKIGQKLAEEVISSGKVYSAEEMRESANTVREAGFEPFMASAIADKQQWVADQAAAGVFGDLPKGARWQDYADRLLAARPDAGQKK